MMDGIRFGPCLSHRDFTVEDLHIRKTGQAIYDALRRMDEEAITEYTTVNGTFIAGLRQYHRHYNTVYGGSLGCEPSWSQRLAAILCDQGIPTVPEKRYPASA